MFLCQIHPLRGNSFQDQRETEEDEICCDPNKSDLSNAAIRSDADPDDRDREDGEDGDNGLDGGRLRWRIA